jgi:hypothetical protein
MRFPAIRTGAVALGALLLMISVLASSCGVPLTKKEVKLEEHRRFFYLLPEEQYRLFDKYPIEKQFDIYIVSMTMNDPPDAEFANLIASRRLPAVPFLIKMLGQESFRGYETDPDTVDNIKEKTIYILRTMSRRGYHDVKGDTRAVRAIRDAIGGMRNPHSRQVSEEYLRDILHQED